MKYKVLGKQNNTSMCFVCGLDNSLGLHAKFYECLKINETETPDQTEEKVLIGIINPKSEHQSYPNRMHGGVAAALLDEVIGRANWIDYPDVWGVTIELTTRYRKPTPLDQTLYVEGKITKVHSRGFDGEGKIITADGTVCVTAFARYLNSPIEKIAGAELDDKNWFLAEEELPEYIEI